MREKHLVLLANIGTFAEEDEAFDLLTLLTWLLPVIIIVSAIFDLVLAVVYLKWLHPWKIILQEVCYQPLVFFQNGVQTIFLGAKQLEWSRGGWTGQSSEGKGWFWICASHSLFICHIPFILFLPRHRKSLR